MDRYARWLFPACCDWVMRKPELVVQESAPTTHGYMYVGVAGK